MVRTKQEIDRLVERYYSGDSSLEEEAALLLHFTSENSDKTNEVEQAQYVYFKSKKEDEPSVNLTFKPDRLAEPVGKSKTHLSHILLRIAAAFVVSIGAGYFILYRTNYFPATTFVTAEKELTSIVLPDSTVVWLNEKTTLTCDESFNTESRTVQLHGEAYFEVHRNASIPFIVKTDMVTTKVLGTSFNLRSYQKEKTIELNVMEGQVDFGATKRISVSKGMKGSYSHTQQQLEVSTINANANSWKTHALVFDDTKLLIVIQDLERHFHCVIKPDDSLLNCHFTGQFNNPVLEDVMKVMGYSLNLKYAWMDGRYVLSGNGCEER